MKGTNKYTIGEIVEIVALNLEAIWRKASITAVSHKRDSAEYRTLMRPYKG